MKIDELNAVGAIFTLIIGSGMYFKNILKRNIRKI